MKNIITICAAILLTVNVFAQAPNKMSYQAVIRNSSNALVTNQIVGMRISILQGTPTGVAAYIESQTPTTNSNGLASVEIGSGSVISGTFSTIDWANGPYFIKTETDPTGGTNYTITGNSQLLSVPYALYAENSGSSTPGPAGPQGPVGPQGPAGTGGFTHYIGEEFGGGVIFHLWKDTQGVEHGLIVDKTNLSTGLVWSNVQIAPAQSSTWDGLSNSNDIVGQPGHTSSAASLCLNSTNGGQSDWYLPAIDELSLLWHNRFNVNKSLSVISGATVLPMAPGIGTSIYFWSSSQNYPGGQPFRISFTFGDASFVNVGSNLFYVRAVRAF
jgi:hypothetical protein